MKRFIVYSMLGFLFFQTSTSCLFGQSRLIRRVQREMENKAIEEIFGKEEEAKSADEAESRARNRKGGGLDQELPDVTLHIAEAGESFSAKNYAGARSNLRQALWGVELEMGQNVLRSLPAEVGSLSHDADADRVSSTGVGFVGLLIERIYRGPDDMELSLSIGSDSGLLSLANLAMASGQYQTTSDQDNQKQVRFKDHNAYLYYDEDSGYGLSVPFGQSSVFLLQGVNYASEGEFMAAASQFDIQTIKQKLGGQ
jgi:hypothetical protein